MSTKNNRGKPRCDSPPNKRSKWDSREQGEDAAFTELTGRLTIGKQPQDVGHCWPPWVYSMTKVVTAQTSYFG